jgi:DnaA family protein
MPWLFFTMNSDRMQYVMTKQLPLHIQLRDDATFANYIPGPNQEAWQAVQNLVLNQGDPYLYLWGNPGVGCTHLLEAACQAMGEHNLPTVYISLQDAAHTSPQILQNLENLALICVDDLESIAGQAAWEEALFHLFNQIRAKQGRLLVANHISPHHSTLQLPDLKSRLTWGVTYHLHHLSDLDLLQALQLRAQNRGITLNTTVGQFLITRCTRHIPELLDILTRLDQASLAAQRHLTIPFVKRVLDL